MKKIYLFLTLFLLSACSPKEEDFKATVPETPVTLASSEASASELTLNSDEGQPTEKEKESAGNQEGNEDLSSPVDVAIPAQINHTAPFYSQAPEGDWAEPWQNACEEASLILAHYGMKGKTLTKAEFKKMVLEMVDWENQNFGYYQSTPVDMVVQLYNAFFEDALKTKVIESPTVEDLKKELAQGHLIVAPFAGRQLGNPFYSGEGPYYHMMVLKGYDDRHFITNDVGTRRGANFTYPYQTIIEAMHDYKEPGIESQPARVIVLYEK